jgi:Flp pilus assembly protein TadD
MSATQYLEQGLERIRSQDFQGAEAAFRKAVQLDANHATAYVL